MKKIVYISIGFLACASQQALSMEQKVQEADVISGEKKERSLSPRPRAMVFSGHRVSTIEREQTLRPGAVNPSPRFVSPLPEASTAETETRPRSAWLQVPVPRFVSPEERSTRAMPTLTVESSQATQATQAAVQQLSPRSGERSESFQAEIARQQLSPRFGETGRERSNATTSPSGRQTSPRPKPVVIPQGSLAAQLLSPRKPSKSPAKLAPTETVIQRLIESCLAGKELGEESSLVSMQDFEQYKAAVEKDPIKSAQVNYFYGTMHQEGKAPFTKDDEKATQYLSRAAHQDKDIWTKTKALFALGRLFFNGENSKMSQNDDSAWMYLSAVDPWRDPENAPRLSDREKAEVYYMLGMLSRKKDAMQAGDYFMKASKYKDFPDIAAAALTAYSKL